MPDINDIAIRLPGRISEQRQFLNDALQRLGGTATARELIQTASLLTSALVSALNESGEHLKRGISRLDREFAASQESYEKGMASLLATAERLPSLEPEWANYSLGMLRSTQKTIDTAYELALKRDQITREFFLSYYEHWFEATYRTLGLFTSEHQLEQLKTLLNVLVGMIGGVVGTVRDVLELLLSLRPPAVDPEDFRGPDQFERYAGACRLLLVLFEILTDIASGAATTDDLKMIPLEAHLDDYQVSLEGRVNERIRRLLDPRQETADNDAMP